MAENIADKTLPLIQPFPISSINILARNFEYFNGVAAELAKINEIIKPSTSLLKLASQQLSVAESIARSIPKFDVGIFSATDSVLKNVEAFAKQALEEANLAEEIAKDPEFTRFPFLSAGYLSIPEMRQLMKEWKEGKKNEVIDYVQETLRMPAIHEDILRGIDEKSILHKRKTLFQEALWAHKEGKYYLSIPLLFPIIEGTLVDKYSYLFVEQPPCEKCGRPFRTTAYPVLQKVESKLKKDNPEYMFAAQYLGQIKHLMMSFSSERNPILHGSKIDYQSETLSAALILAVTSLDFHDEDIFAKERI